MDEIRSGNKVTIETKRGESIQGCVIALEYDRVAIKIDSINLDVAKKIKELDELKIIAKTHFGIKTMISAVIATLGKHNHIIVENNPSLSIEQKREFVRVVCNFNILINKNNKIFHGKTLNISAGGIAFKTNDEQLKEQDEIEIEFPKEIFEQNFTCCAKIIKIKDDNYIAQFNNINKYNESKIMKFVFKNISKSSTGS